MSFEDGVENIEATVEELIEHLDEPRGPFWLTVEGGTIVGVCEQHTP
ncbi:MAG: hypothetical protein S0880_29280 [Actinomycetota bacterium]|nr:hypothetical protein [Actinomycetota bacterium]